MLTDTQIRNLKPAEKAKKYADGGGLYLYVAKTGSKLWRMAYRFNDKEKLLSFGEYPIVSLKDARTKRNEAKKLLADGIDPGKRKKTPPSSRKPIPSSMLSVNGTIRRQSTIPKKTEGENCTRSNTIFSPP